MKIIAKAQKGKEFLYNLDSAGFAPDSSAQKMADDMNKANYKLGPGEVWHVYDAQYGDDLRIFKKFYYTKNCLKVKYL